MAESGILNSLLLFLLVGAIPGTNYNVPSSVMLLVIITIMWLVLFRFTAIEGLPLKRSAKHQLERKKAYTKTAFRPNLALTTLV